MNLDSQSKYNSCSDADEVKGYKCVEEDHECKQKSKCELQTDTSKCDSTEVPNGYKCEKKGNSCTLTSSSKILGIFKISFALLIKIFGIILFMRYRYDFQSHIPPKGVITICF